MIRTANTSYHVIKGGGYRAFITKQVKARHRMNPNWQTGGLVLAAEVNHGRWIVKCPDCPEAVDAEPGEPFFCPNCANAKNNGLAHLVVWPKERAEIEAALLERADVANQNWRADETVEQLKAENERNKTV